jgi:predicted secreted protein
MWRKKMKVVRTTTAMESQRDYFSDSDSDALTRIAFGEGENSQQLGGLNLDANGVIKGRASNLFNVTEEQVENPLYWINL